MKGLKLFMVYNADDKKQVKKARDDADLSAALALDVIRNVMKTPAGRQWMYGILDMCHIYGNPFIPGQQDVTAFNLGQANIGKVLLGNIQSACPDLYLTMIQEAKGTSS